MRIILSLLSAAIVTLVLLFLMSQLISDEQVAKQAEVPKVELTNMVVPQKEPIREPAELKPPQPPAIEASPLNRGQAIETVLEDNLNRDFSVTDPEMDVLNTVDAVGIPQMELRQESAAMALYRRQPNYPISAQMDGIEGWVMLRYDVDTSGSLSNISVIDSEPRSIFEKEAIKALKKWKFKPAMTNGQPIASAGQTVKIEFNMDNN